MLEKDDSFSRMDTENYLCVMLIRLAAANRAKDTEFLKIVRDTGKYTGFFPEPDDVAANAALLKFYPDLETAAPADGKTIFNTVVKQSLENVLKMTPNMAVIDEGHKAYSDKTRDALCKFNPSFVLELTATPNVKTYVSNILVDVTGRDLKDEQMIKLPINIFNVNAGDWREVLTRAHAKLSELNDNARALQAEEGRYIRPIMVVRVERTGKDQRDGKKVHAEDAKAYLTERLGVRAEEIRIKSSETDELGDADLLSPLCPVRYVITKDALKEGWDCPFAYVLALLDKTTAQTAMTQMIGRVLRQPEARLTSIDALNQCYVYCYDQDVNISVEHVRKGLEQEGLTGISEFVRAGDSGETPDGDESAATVSIKRREMFADLKIFLPQILHKTADGWRDLHYENDVLRLVAWQELAYDTSPFLHADDDSVTHTTVDVAKGDGTGQGELSLTHSTQRLEPEGEKRLDLGFLSRLLLDVIPNPWHAARLLAESIVCLRRAKLSDGEIWRRRLHLIDTMKTALKRQVSERCEAIFREKLKSGEICFRLMMHGDERLNFEIAQELKAMVRPDEKKLQARSGDPIKNSLYATVYEKSMNGLERDLALFLSDNDAVTWWHRMASRQEYGLQGWQRNKIYPDFIACRDESRLFILETKGLQLKGNDDTEYKRRLFDLLNSAYSVGTMDLPSSDGGASVSLHMLMQDDFKEEATRLLTA